MRPFMKIEEVAELIKDNIKYIYRDDNLEKTKKDENRKHKDGDDNKDDFLKINLDDIPDEVIKVILP